MKKLLLILSAAIIPALTSCTINDKGEFELTWLFWAILIGIILIFVVTGITTNKEAKDRGMSVDEYLEHKRKEQERTEMRTGFEIEYLGGYPGWPNPCKVNFSIRNTSLVFRRGTQELVLPKNYIVSISNEKSGNRSVGKTAAGAIVGGVLTGGIGLIVGGALGARKKDTSEVFVSYNYNGVVLTLNLRPGKNADKVYAWINSVFA